MANINEILARAAALRNETALNSIDPERAGGIMYDTLLALNELWLQQGAALVISKIYASVAAMNADTSPVSDLTGKPIRPGMVVVIASSDSDNGSVYRYNGTSSPRWSLVGKIGNITPEDSLTSDSTQLPLAAHQGKVLDGKISQLGQYFYIQGFLEAHIDANGRLLYGVKSDGSFYFGAGCPPQVQEYVLLHKAEILLALNSKVDKESGKSLIDSNFSDACSSIDWSEYLKVITDAEGKLIFGIKQNGTCVVFGGIIADGSMLKKNYRFSNIGIDLLSLSGASQRNRKTITMPSGVENKVYLDGNIHAWHYKMISIIAFSSGTPHIIIGKEHQNYGAYIEISGSTLKISSMGVIRTSADIGFSFVTGRDYTIVWGLNVSDNSLKTLSIEVYDNYGNYYTYTTDYTVQAYGNPFMYSESANCVIKDWSMSMQHYYAPATEKMIVCGHSFVEADSLGNNRGDCYVRLLDKYNGEGSVANCGLGGDRIVNMNKKLSYYIMMNRGAEYAFLNIGANDITMSLEDMISNFIISIKICEDYGVIPILATINPDKTGYRSQVFQSVNEWIRNSGYAFVDFDKVFYNPDGTINESLFLADGMHPTTDGHLMLFRRIQMDCPFLF